MTLSPSCPGVVGLLASPILSEAPRVPAVALPGSRFFSTAPTLIRSGGFRSCDTEKDEGGASVVRGRHRYGRALCLGPGGLRNFSGLGRGGEEAVWHYEEERDSHVSGAFMRNSAVQLTRSKSRSTPPGSIGAAKPLSRHLPPAEVTVDDSLEERAGKKAFLRIRLCIDLRKERYNSWIFLLCSSFTIFRFFSCKISMKM